MQKVVFRKLTLSMIHGKFIFYELIDYPTKENLYWLVKKCQRKKYVKTFICWSHLLILS